MGVSNEAVADGMAEERELMQETVRAVIDLIKAGDAEEAILRLEREFWPKWHSVDHSRSDLFAHKEAAPAGAVG